MVSIISMGFHNNFLFFTWWLWNKRPLLWLQHNVILFVSMVHCIMKYKYIMFVVLFYKTNLVHTIEMNVQFMLCDHVD